MGCSHNNQVGECLENLPCTPSLCKLLLFFCTFTIPCTYHYLMSFPGGSVVKNQPADTRDTGDRGSIPGLARSPGEGNGNPLQILLPG